MRIWNITDDPRRKDIAETSLVIFQKIVKPGAFVTVQDDEIKNSDKLQKEATLGLIWIGNKLPKEYLSAKSSTKASLKSGVKRAHGESNPAFDVNITSNGLQIREDKPRWSKKGRRDNS